MSNDLPKTATASLVLHDALVFSGRRMALGVFLSLLVLIPCFWHRHIEAGDLASHTYNAWLAQLVATGQAPGVYVVPQWNNVLFDFSLYHLGNLLGLRVAEKVVVSAAVLIFFWGVFSLLAGVTGKPPWLLVPCIVMLAYGYAFSMGFINYYLSVGLACIALAMLWRGGARNWLCAAPVALLTWVAHPIGFLWLAGTLAYVFLWRRIPGLWRIALPIAAVAALFGLHAYITRHAIFDASWRQDLFYLRNGTDQLILYGHRYAHLAHAALAWGILCFLAGVLSRVWGREASEQPLRLLVELYVIALFVTALVPENLRSSMYAGWIGLLVSRLTVLSAILGLAVLNCVRPQKWFFAGFAACAVAFFAFLFQDTRVLNRLEDSAESVILTLPYGTRVVPVLNAPGDWRVEFIHHVVERACIGRCFSYANYEPASLQFRVRVHSGSAMVTASSEDAEAMASGEYVVKASDPPLTAIYQCGDSDFTQLCAAPLKPGEKTEVPALDSGDN